MEIFLVLGSGILLYPLLAFGDRLIGAPALGSALFEEAFKLLLLASAAFYGSVQARRDRAALRDGERGSQTASDIEGQLAFGRSLLSGAARGLGLGLATVAVFAACENLAYFIALPGTDILGRLLWSEPVHLVAALAESIGVFQGFKLFVAEGLGSRGRGQTGTELVPGTPRRTTPGLGSVTGLAVRLLAIARALSLSLGFVTLGFAWHLLANVLASGPLSPALFTAVALANFAALLVLGRLFARHVVIGGFIYGAE